MAEPWNGVTVGVRRRMALGVALLVLIPMWAMPVRSVDAGPFAPPSAGPVPGQTPGTGPPTSPPPTTPPTTAPPTTPSTSPPTSPTTAPGSTTLPSTTTTTQPGDSIPNPTTTLPSTAKPGTAPSGDPVGGGDAGSGDAEVANPVAPERRTAPSGRTPRGVGGGGSATVVITESATAKANLDAVQVAYDEALTTVGRLQDRLVEIDRRIVELTAEQIEAVEDYVEAKAKLSRDAANAYVQVTSGPGPADFFLTARTPNELGTLQLYGRTVVESARKAADEIQALRRRLGDELVDLGDEKISATGELDLARATVALKDVELRSAKTAMMVFDLGSEIFISGYVFPVDDPHDFVDSYGAPRMFGTGFAHFHEGADIMAPFGTALFACENGTIVRVRQNVLGGITLSIRGDSGTEYYYAHLSAYADGVSEGMPVTAGTVVGFVGNTGNARYTAPHLHYEIHPGGGDSINPYALLKVADELEVAEPAPTS